jgi:hypothetical protein
VIEGKEGKREEEERGSKRERGGDWKGKGKGKGKGQGGVSIHCAPYCQINCCYELNNCCEV